MRSCFRVIFICVDVAAVCASLLPADNLNDNSTVWLQNVTSNLCIRRKLIMNFIMFCHVENVTIAAYSESMQISGCRPVAFWMTRNSLVITSITCVVWNTKSPFFRHISDYNHEKSGRKTWLHSETWIHGKNSWKKSLLAYLQPWREKQQYCHEMGSTISDKFP